MKHIVYIRDVDEDIVVLGVFGNRGSAEKKRNVINGLIDALAPDTEHSAWAYVGPLRSAVVSAERVAREALGTYVDRGL